MKLKYIKIISTLILVIFATTSCLKDLELELKDPNTTAADVFYDNPDSYRQVLAKLYAGLAVTGQDGPHGSSDISGIDEGFGQYIRGLWQAQELCTDEAVIGWANAPIEDFHEMDWNADGKFIRALYDRIFYQITACNEYIRQTSDSKLSDRNVSNELKAEVLEYRAEARFLRALSYSHALDLFGNVPFVTENDEVGFFMPAQTNRTDLFNYVESELIAIESLMVDATSNEYGRADKAAIWMLLSKLYLNANVYVGNDMNSESLVYSKKIIDANYNLEGVYENLFLADNHNASGVIFPITYDGVHTKTWGGTTYLIHAAIGGSMDTNDFGVTGAWGGLRTTSALVNKFPSPDPDVLNMSLGNDSTWGIVGDATPGGWGGPDLKLKEDGSVLSIFTTLGGGGSLMKFRENDGWANNYGDDDPADGNLEAGGGNITVTPGIYKVTFDLTNLTYSITAVTADSRGNFFTTDQNLEINDISSFNDGYAVIKFKNIDQNGNPGSDPTGTHTDTDYPLFRLADAYLMFAEASLRGASGADMGRSVQLINELRERAYGNTTGNISSSDLSLDFILDERARELHWEGHRRTDLIRFGKFTGGSYLWPWKGGVSEGVAVDEHYNLYPIPSSDMNSNTNLTQNPGY
ncbi:MAG: RagB/SusD family nutrient uptake outer membrane protein [Flavobacteriaceae bacterium]